MNRTSQRYGDDGFTLVELMGVVAVIATLVLIAIPVFISATNLAEERTCYRNQITLSRAAETYLGLDAAFQRADLAGMVDADHPVVIENILGEPPRCPSGDDPVDPNHPTIAEGAYQFDATGEVLPCTLGSLGPHGSYSD